eukprot:scaffold2062_cov181-Ochromonas_danica.AAC.11
MGREQAGNLIQTRTQRAITSIQTSLPSGPDVIKRVRSFFSSARMVTYSVIGDLLLDALGPVSERIVFRVTGRAQRQAEEHRRADHRVHDHSRGGEEIADPFDYIWSRVQKVQCVVRDGIGGSA